MPSFNKVPIKNIYYMLMYAWGILPEKDAQTVGQEDYADIYSLLIDVLTDKLPVLIRKGLHRDYVNHKELTPTLKGRVDFSASLHRQSFRQAKMVCEFDELSHDILLNQVIKSTLMEIGKVKELAPPLRKKVFHVLPYFTDITAIPLTPRVFQSVVIGRNTRHYHLVISICRLLFEHLLINEETGDRQFVSFDRSQNLGRFFEKFIYHFYRLEQNEFHVCSENVEWATDTDQTHPLLPRMTTDLSLISPKRKIIMDTKFYANSLSSHYGTEKFHNQHLYQLLTYLTNNQAVKKYPFRLEGILLYPKVDKQLNEQLTIHGHSIRICTLDLTRDWQSIHQRCLSLPG
nr:restriction endonuclease [Bacillus sp. REN10]